MEYVNLSEAVMEKLWYSATEIDMRLDSACANISEQSHKGDDGAHGDPKRDACSHHTPGRFHNACQSN